jgi:hypothetical protein
VLGYEDNSIKTMTFSNKTNTQLTDAEYDEMIALKNAIDYNISQVILLKKWKQFAEYLVRSLRERGG